MSNLQRNRPPAVFQCGVCDKVINGTANTIHLALKAHCEAEMRNGTRRKPEEWESLRWGEPLNGRPADISTSRAGSVALRVIDGSLV